MSQISERNRLTDGLSRGDKDVVQVKDRLEADAAKKGEAHA